jgi:hypothetical protein
MSIHEHITNTNPNGERRGSRVRVAAWSLAGLAMLVPAVAMQFTDEVAWSLFDFVFMGALIAAVGGAMELTVRLTRSAPYRAAVGVALAGAFLLIWLNGAVGIIGSENNDANLMYFGVLAVAALGAMAVRLEARPMTFVLVATAAAQMLVAAIAIAGGWAPAGDGTKDLVMITGFFGLVWLTSAALFREAARGQGVRSVA